SERRLENSLVETFGQWSLFGNVGVARADGSDDFAGKLSAAITHRRVAFPTMIKMRRQESVEIVSQTLFKFLTTHRRVRHCLLQDTSFQFSRRRRHGCRSASLDRAANRQQSFVAHRALHRVLGHEPIGFRTYYALNVVGQKIFEIHTKHRFFTSRRFCFYASLIATTFILRRIFASSMRPRLIRDLTVPSGIFRRSTISW